MKIALIADLHANRAALDAVLAGLRRDAADRVVCLGDVAATGPQPREVIGRLRDLGCPVVMGNGDAYLLDPQPAPGAGEEMRKIEAIDRWCRDQLAPADLDFVRTFRPTVEVALGEETTLLCYHGSPRSYDDVIAATTPDDELAPMLAGDRATVMAGGHWHVQLLRRYQESVLVNPGSVGLAYDLLPDGEARVPPRAEYAVIATDGDALSIAFRRVPYDREATIRAMFESGMPHADWWSTDWRR